MILEQIEKFEPFNEQEIIDKKRFIEFIKTNPDIFTRKNENGHITASAWIVNKERTKVLMCYHLIYDSYAWLGGHADGEEDTLKVALKEVNEESGLKNIKVLSEDIYSIEILPVKEHIKHGKIIKEHLHYNVTYLFECDENEPLIVNEQENKDLRWFYIDELEQNVREKNMYNNVYYKLIKKGLSNK